MLVVNKKEWTLETCNKIPEPQSNYIGWKKTDKTVTSVWLHLCKWQEVENQPIAVQAGQWLPAKITEEAETMDDRRGEDIFLIWGGCYRDHT